MNRRIILIILIVLFSTLFTTACWNRVEVNERAIVAGIGIDKAKEEGKINITVQLIIPARIKGPAQGATRETEAVWVASSTGRTVFDAVRNFTLRSGRRLFWAHSMVIVIGEEIAKEGIDRVVDWFERHPDYYLRSWVLVARGDAKKIMESKPELEMIPAYEIVDIAKGSIATSKVIPLNLKNFIGILSDNNRSAYTAGIEEIVSFEIEKGEKVRSFRLASTAVFKGFKLKEWLDAYETRGLLWVTDKVKGGIIIVECPLDPNKLISLEIIRSSSKIKPEIKDGNLIITVEVTEEGIVGETRVPCDVLLPHAIERLEKEKEELIRREINIVVNKAQELNTDIFGFSEAVYRSLPKEWKKLEGKWDEIFPEIEVKVEVNAKIRRIGLVTKPARPE
jgi:spore germination protein KC